MLQSQPPTTGRAARASLTQRSSNTDRPERPRGRTAPAVLLTRVLFVLIATLSVSNFHAALMPAGITNLQQAMVLVLWGALVLATAFTPPVLRIGMGLEMLALLAFYGFAVVSVAWSDLSPTALLKGGALAVTTFCAYRIATHMRIDDVVDCCIVALTGITAASVFFVLFVPAIGIDQTWMHGGEWQGVFESKQSLGTAAAVLMFFTAYRFLRRGGWLTFAVSFLLGLACVIGSGSRGGAALALAACATLYLSGRSTGLLKWLTFGPLLMSGVAIVMIAYLCATGFEYIPLFGVKVDFTERAIIWQYALSHFGERPLLGYGLDGFWSIDSIYHNFDREHGWVLDNYHNGYIAILTETGIAGMALFIGSIVLFGHKMRWVLQRGVLYRAHAVLVIALVNLIFFIDFTETFFLRSTNIVSVLVASFLFVACAVPASNRRGGAAVRGRLPPNRGERGSPASLDIRAIRPGVAHPR